MGLRYLREIQEGERESEPWGREREGRERETYQRKKRKKGKWISYGTYKGTNHTTHPSTTKALHQLPQLTCNYTITPKHYPQ